MKEIDDTPAPESENERCERAEHLGQLLLAEVTNLRERIEALEKRLANLETQRTPQDENDDPEWFS